MFRAESAVGEKPLPDVKYDYKYEEPQSRGLTEFGNVRYDSKPAFLRQGPHTRSAISAG
jgi:hypothetical protein